jgi:hypothetical protein
MNAIVNLKTIKQALNELGLDIEDVKLNAKVASNEDFTTEMLKLYVKYKIQDESIEPKFLMFIFRRLDAIIKEKEANPKR